MSTRTTLRPTTVIDGGDMAATSVTSSATLLQSVTMVNYQVTWTGSTPVGTLAVEASNDCVVSATGGVSGGTWNPVPLDLAGVSVSTIPVTGNTGKGMIDIDGIAAYALRLVYTKSSGTGTINAIVTGKVK